MEAYRWSDEDGDQGEVFDWASENPDDESAAALRVREAGDWECVFVGKEHAVKVIAFLTEFHGL